MISNSLLFYKHLQSNATIKDTFYHFSTLPAIVQYEKLFGGIEKLRLNKDAKILDWGCGNGWFSYYLIYKGFSDVISYAYGWDSIRPAMNQIPTLRVVNGADFSLSSASQLPFDDHSFDIVFSIGVLEHVHETGGSQLDSLKEIKRILKPNGVFFCYHLPNKYTWIEFIKSKIAPNKDYLHTRKFSRADIFSMCSKADLKVLETRRYNLLPYNLFRRSFLNHPLVGWIYRFIDVSANFTPLNLISQCHFFIAKKS